MGNKTFFRKAQTGRMSYGDIFSDVFKSHTQEDTARMFIAGTPLTTPSESEMLTKWTKPYAFFRFFMIGLLSLLVLYFTSIAFENEKCYSALLSLIPWLVPMTCLILVWELHVPRNISLYEVIQMVFAGGVLSLLISLIGYDLIINYARINFDDCWAGLVEEPAKLLAIYLFLGKKDKERPYILNGILIGFAVGTGFSAMESVGYTFTQGGLSVAVGRALVAVASHGLWASLYGGALAMVKGRDRLRPSHLLRPEFLLSFAAAIFLHFCNNTDWGLPSWYAPVIGVIHCQYVILIVVNVIIWLPLVRRGVNQIVQISVRANGGLTNAVEGREPIEPVSDWGLPVQHKTPEGCIWYLEGLTGDWAGKKVDLKDGMNLIMGRNGKKSNVVLEYSPRVSGVHCEFHFSEGRLTVRDLDSRNGTYLENRRLRPGTENTVPEGSTIFLGDHTCSFRFVKETRRIPYGN